MSFEPINSFVRQVYKIIDNDQVIKQSTKGVYLSINQNPEYPFVYVKINQIISQLHHIKYGYNIDFDISIFYRDKNICEPLKLGNLIDSLLQIKNFHIAEYKIIGLQKQSFLIDKSQDTVTNKLNINYLSFIRQK
jgi:hypothetical protein